MRCIVRGVGDVGSAVAHALCRAGHHVAIHDSPAPTAHRRGMAFVDAVFDGQTALDGVTARRVDDLSSLSGIWASGGVAIYVGAFSDILAVGWDVLVDARMRKRAQAEDQRSCAPLVIGLGPGFTVGENCHRAIETGWDDLGRIVEAGSTAALHGEPRSILGRGRERLVYAPAAGPFLSDRAVGDLVDSGERIATIGTHELTAPLAGVLRGLTRSGVTVDKGTKVIEIDPRGKAAPVTGLGERPRRIAEGVIQLV